MAKRLLGVAIATVLLGTVTAAWSGDIRVGFINPAGPREFWNQVNATMLAAASQLGIADRGHRSCVVLPDVGQPRLRLWHRG